MMSRPFVGQWAPKSLMWMLVLTGCGESARSVVPAHEVPVTGLAVDIQPPPPPFPPVTEPLPTTDPVLPTEPPAQPPPATWAPLSWAHEQPGQYNSDVYRWLDAQGEQRTAVLTRNNAMDPGGSHGGMLRQFRYRVGQQERVSTGTGASSGPGWVWNGWGYLVSHGGNGSVSTSSNITGNYRQVFVGRHHALHEFTWNLPIGGVPVKTTVHWFFSTGHDHPVYAVTFDSSAAGSGGLSVSSDSRTPYGDIAWDGDGTQAWVDGVKWGDKRRFFSRDEPLTAQSKWDYTQLNVVPYAAAWSRSADAEMGMVQTLDWLQHNTGGTWFHNNWGHVSENRAESDVFGSWMMPPNWNWPYQLCQYEMSDTQPTRSKRLAWGLMYGAVGSPSYYGYGYESVGVSHPYQSYSVFMVMGRQSGGVVDAQVSEVEHLLGTQLSASLGSVVTQGPGGVGRTDSVNYAVAGYNSTYGVHEFQAASGGAFSVTLNAAAGALQNPTFLIRGMDALPTSLSLDGVPLTADLDYFASFDSSTRRVWLTLHRTWSGSHILTHLPANP
ncbi:hypothetical protein [Melittangium boletus]|nr:hypothetical protein [Melittangium boletus]